MSQKIHNLKFDVEKANDVVTVKVPAGAKFLSVANVGDRATVYYVFVTGNEVYGEVEKRILFVRTGHEFTLPANYRFLGTMVFYGGEYVLHAYDVTQD